jgi:hypothetical protein
MEKAKRRPCIRNGKRRNGTGHAKARIGQDWVIKAAFEIRTRQKVASASEIDVDVDRRTDVS